MLGIAIGALLLSAASAYLVGSAFVGPRDSFWRTKRGIWVVILLGGTFISLPPQLTALDQALGPMQSMATGMSVDTGLTWPEAISKGAYVVIWLVSSIAALLVGLRIWQVGTPEWGGGSGKAYDSSGASRISSLLPLADTLADSLDTIARANLKQREIDAIAPLVRDVGRRYAADLPEREGEVYSLVAARVPASLAGPVTGFLLQGAGRRGSSAS